MVKKVKKDNKKKKELPQAAKKIDLTKIQKELFKQKQRPREIEEVRGNEEFSQILKPSKAPILERIAEAIETPLRGIFAPDTQDKKNEVSYKGTRSDYKEMSNPRRDTNERVNYSETSPDYLNMIEKTKAEKDRQRNIGIMRPVEENRKRERTDIESHSFELELDSKKYVNKGDYK